MRVSPFSVLLHGSRLLTLELMKRASRMCTDVCLYLCEDDVYCVCVRYSENSQAQSEGTDTGKGFMRGDQETSRSGVGSLMVIAHLVKETIEGASAVLPAVSASHTGASSVPGCSTSSPAPR